MQRPSSHVFRFNDGSIVKMRSGSITDFHGEIVVRSDERDFFRRNQDCGGLAFNFTARDDEGFHVFTVSLRCAPESSDKPWNCDGHLVTEIDPRKASQLALKAKVVDCKQTSSPSPARPAATQRAAPSPSGCEPVSFRSPRPFKANHGEEIVIRRGGATEAWEVSDHDYRYLYLYPYAADLCETGRGATLVVEDHAIGVRPK